MPPFPLHKKTGTMKENISLIIPVCVQLDCNKKARRHKVSSTLCNLTSYKLKQRVIPNGNAQINNKFILALYIENVKWINTIFCVYGCGMRKVHKEVCE